MADKKFNLDFYAKVQADVSSVKDVVKNLKNQLETLKLPAGATKNFEKTFTNLEKSIQDFESAASNGITNLADTKKIDAAWKKISGLFSTLGIQIKDLNSISDQVFPKEVSNNISKAAKALGEYQAKIEAIKKSQSYTEKSSAKADADSKAKTAANEWQKQQGILDKKQRDYDAKQNAWNQNRAAQYQDQKDQISKITQEIDAQNAKLQEQKEIQKQLRDAGVTTKEGAVKESHKRAITSAEADIAGMEKAQKLAKENLELAKKAEAQAKKAQASAKGQETKILKKVDAKDPKAVAATQAKTAAMQAYVQAQSEAATKAQELADIEINLAQARDRLATLQGQSAQAEQVGKRVQDIEDEIEALDKTRDATKKAAAANAEYEAKLNESKQALEDQKVVVASYETAMNDAKNTANSLGAEMDQMELDQAKTEWEALIKVIKEFTGIDLTATQGDIQEITRVLEEYKADQIKKAPETIEKLGEAARQAEPQLEKMKKAGDEVTESITNMTRTERDIENLKDQILDFFSISNTVQIFKDAVRSAFETVKELDAVMTETAVVTDFSIGDMWDKLPEYSDEANKLGTSISSLYEATTLYYQQGLKSQEAMDVGIETMKMARIAGMDAAAATEAMTAALRGFNMEINEMSATRINDVYSELAAITAADTSQIATAMSKTASIAASANMEFETTAALLAQIIETTQEAPETAGTAMKTIIARFTEVKQLFDEGMLTGKDSEGEEININKIDAALKKVGISLSDFLRGEKGIDDIFLELASKWDSLDLATQRYIATTAAGSRQQSRFLAMMGNYERTMELVTAANNSAGASQKQFDKTLESLDAKLQRLKNAWAEFTMGLANNELIKGAVDLLTEILEKLNQFTDFGSDGLGGIITMLTRLTTVILGLKGGKAIIEGLLKTFISGKTAWGKQMLEGLDGMGLGKALFKKWQLDKGIIGWTDEAVEATKVLSEVESGFAGAKAGAIAFGKSLAKLSIYIAVLAAIAIAVYAIVKSFKDAQNEAKLDKINEEIKQLNTEAQNAQDELEEIGSARTELNGLQDTLNGLTKGTSEWKAALIDVNQQVLELIEKYPSLEAEIGENGALTIKDESWDNLLKNQQKVITNISAQRIAAESERENIIKSINFDQFAVEFVEAKNEDDSQSSNRESQHQANIAERKIRDARWSDSIDNWLLKLIGPEAYRNFVNMGDSMINTSKGALATGTKVDSSGKTEARIAGDEEVKTKETYKKLLEVDREQLELIARYFADNNLTDLATEDQQRDALAAGGLSKDEIDKFLPTFSKLLKDSEHPFYDWIASIQENTDSQQKLTHQFVANSLTGTNLLEKDYADSVANIITRSQKQTIDQQVDSKVEDLKAEYTDSNGELDSITIAQEYAKIMGYEAVNGEVYKDGTYSEKVDTSPEAMLRAIATEKVTVEVQEKAETTAGAIGKEKKQQEVFDSLFSTEGSEIKSSQLYKYSNKDGSLKFEDIAKDIGGYETIEEMAAAMGQEVQDVKDILISNFEIANERVAASRQNVAKNMTKFTKQTDQKDYEVNADLFLKLEQKYGDKVYDMFEGAFTKLSNIEDMDFSSDAYEALRNAMMEATSTEEMEQAWSFFESIDFSNPINALETITNEAENGTGAAKRMAIAMKQSSGSFLGLSSQISALTQTNEFEEINAELTQILEANEEISATDVDNLAKSYKSLDKILKQNKITAAGLGKVLEGLNKGEIEAWQLTDAVLASASAFHSLDSIASKAIRNIEEFDLGIDENSIGETVVGWGDLIQENLEKGAVGNSQNFKILDYLFPGWQKDLEGEALIKEMDRLSELLQGNGQNLRQMWSDIYAGKDFQGNKIQLSDEHQAMGLSVRDTGEEIFFEGWEGKNLTSTDLVSWISDAYNVSTELAEAMLTDFKNYSEDLSKELAANDYSTGIEKAYNNLKQINDIKLVDKSEIEALSKIWGKDKDTIRNELTSRGVQVTDFYDEDGIINSYQKISAQLDQALSDGGKTGQKWSQSFIDAAGNINLSDLEKELGKLGITGINAETIKEQAFESVRAGLKEGMTAQIDFTLDDGTTIPVEVTPKMDYEAFNQALNAQVKQQELDGLTAAFSAALASTPVGLEIDQGTILQFVTEVETAMSSVDAQIQISAEPESLAMAGTAIDGVVQTPRTVPITLDVVSSDIGANTYARTVPIYLKVVKSDIPSGGSGSENSAPGPTAANSATGVKNSVRDFTSLVSEEGPELIQKASGGAYLSGTKGPEMVEIEKGDTVYTAEETKEIFKKRNHSLIPGFARGYGEGSAYSGNKGGSGGRSSDDDEETWENPFDKLYNLLRKIDEELHQRERLERRYEKLLEDIGVSANKIVAVSREELAHLEQERKLQEWKISGRNYQIDEYQKENSDLQKYARFVENDRGERVLRIDWDLIDKVTDTDKGERIEEYVSQLEEWDDDLQEAEEALWDIEDAVAEIKERGKDQYEELEDKIKEAIVQSYQDQIDKLSDINDSINDTNAELLDAIQTSIDKQRQDRDNQRTEDELAEKQRRLLYLQQDTSGANALEILRLQDEIEQGREDYTDTLIDQKISELQRQNDEASKQREKQITLLQAQLDHYIESGAVWDEVYSLMESGLDENNGLIRGSRLEQILKNADNFSSLSVIGQQEWWKEFNAMVAEALAYLELGRQLEDLGVSNQEVEIVLPDGSVIKGTVDDQGNVTGENGQTYNNVYQGADGRYYAGENIEEPKDPVVEHPNDGDGGSGGASTPQEETPKYPNWTDDNVIGIAEAIVYGSVSGWGKGQTRWDRLDAKIGPGASTVIQQRVNDIIYGRVKAGQASKHRTEYYYNKFEHGGLADFTGPAWLDGSKSRPEIVLNPQDSRNFIQLRDILSSVLNRGNVNTATENNGDILYDIDINVESIGSDYDVEQVANKVKSLINEDARYRNNNTVSLKR